MKRFFLITAGILIVLLPYAQTTEKENMLETLEENHTDTIKNLQTEDELIITDDLKEQLVDEDESISPETKEKNSFISVEEGFNETDVTVGKNAFFKLDEEDDTIKIKLGKKAIKIVEDYNGADIEFINEEDIADEFNIDYKPKFKGHWAGFDMGINGYLTKNNSFDFGENSYMDLFASKSINININFLEYSLNIARNCFGLVTGLGYELNNYRFEGNNNIMKDNEGMITELDYDSVGLNLTKSKLTTSHLTIPLLLEIQIPAKKKRKVYIAAGVIGGLRLKSHTKVVYKENGKNQKDKEREDFNLSPLRYGVTARIGYKALKLYATYELTPLFEKNKGPELYPFSIGLTLVSF